ncbi:LysR family transcriptional regulator [Lampropedia puyangensis]|uniref:LysR family transcriptional regulator n=1 Tax=Lampropedia puyangensis TaxID=1330072 RepID=A0A4S8FA73_9BURK|nr:LysR family transcriptional regulator [Lampropedia puyangensis]THU03725.1 LysR family transcriptional regulator [Lampropedia puyangensis]
MNFDLGDLRAFVAIADLGSFRAASEQLHLSQPALSRRISKLEEALGVRLLERTTRRVELSALGVNFVTRARHVLFEAENALLGLADQTDRIYGQVSVACVPSAVETILAKVVGPFHAKYPRMRLRILDQSAPDVLTAVMRAEADFGVSYLGLQDADLDFSPLAKESYVMACLPQHPLAKRKHVTWSEMAEHDCVVLAAGSGNRLLIDKELADAGVVLRRISCEALHVPALISLVKAGVGVGAIPRFALHHGHNEPLIRIPLRQPTIQRTIGIVTRRGRRLRPAAEAFLEMLFATEVSY